MFASQVPLFRPTRVAAQFIYSPWISLFCAASLLQCKGKGMNHAVCVCVCVAARRWNDYVSRKRLSNVEMKMRTYFFFCRHCKRDVAKINIELFHSRVCWLPEKSAPQCRLRQKWEKNIIISLNWRIATHAACRRILPLWVFAAVEMVIAQPTQRHLTCEMENENDISARGCNLINGVRCVPETNGAHTRSMAGPSRPTMHGYESVIH